jgi:hypothetical protein
MNLLSGKKPPFAILLLERSLQPIQGVYNIFIYTFPYVAVQRKENPDFTWLQCLMKVVKSGGDDDLDATSRRMSVRRQSINNRLRTSSIKRSLVRSLQCNRGDNLTLPSKISSVENLIVHSQKSRRNSMVQFNVDAVDADTVRDRPYAIAKRKSSISSFRSSMSDKGFHPIDEEENYNQNIETSMSQIGEVQPVAKTTTIENSEHNKGSLNDGNDKTILDDHKFVEEFP